MSKTCVQSHSYAPGGGRIGRLVLSVRIDMLLNSSRVNKEANLYFRRCQAAYSFMKLGLFIMYGI